ncbi:MAG TPA: LysR family transcriptional regulator substrate-binding protein, partial [Pyrinomonadaceae bacterium]|nr:LysR family transcriptional regulator substrate-binding protein [Pyrinomonadaceae bacterium]
LPSILRRFHELHTDVNIEILCGASDQMLNAIQGDMIDLAVIADVPDEAGFERQLIMQDELVLITDPKHRLATTKSVAVRDLADEFLLVQGPKSKIRARIVQALREHNTAFRLAAENVAIEGIKRMVADGLGIGFVPLMCVREEAARGELSVLRVQDIPDQWNLWLVRRKDLPLSDAVRTFIQVSLGSEPVVEKGINKAKAFSFGPRKAMHC